MDKETCNHLRQRKMLVSLNSNNQPVVAQILTDQAQVWEHPCYSFALDAFDAAQFQAATVKITW